MLFNLFDKQFDISPLCVFVFYDIETDFISELKCDEESGELKRKYPGYSFCILKRHDDYIDPDLMDLSEHNLIARVLPKNEERDVCEFCATTDRENSRVDTDLFKFFMEILMEENAKRALTYHSTLDNISEFVRQNLPHLYQSADGVIDQMTQMFQSKIDSAIQSATTVVLRLVDGNVRRRVGTHEEVEEATMIQRWVPELEVDGRKYTLPIVRKTQDKAIFVYMMLYPNADISATSCRRTAIQSEISALVKTLYSGIDDAKSIKKSFTGTNLSRHIGRMKRLVVENEEEFLSVAPFMWISKMEVPLGTSDPGVWTFSPPEKVTIDIENFRNSFNQQKKREEHS